MKRGHRKKKKVLEANYLTGNIRCLAIATINLHPKGAYFHTVSILSSAAYPFIDPIPIANSHHILGTVPKPIFQLLLLAIVPPIYSLYIPGYP